MKRRKRIFPEDPIFYVYALIDPFTRKPFYIGKGIRNRIYAHVKCIEKGRSSCNYHKDNKIKKILSQGGKVIHKKLKENLIESEALRLEEKFIRYFGLENLTNMTYGGEGEIPGEETRKKMSLSRMGEKNVNYQGKALSQEVRKKISEKLKGTVMPEETKEKIRKSMKGNLHLLGHVHTASSRKKMSLSRMGEKNHFYGKMHTEEAKRKMSEKHKLIGFGSNNSNAKKVFIENNGVVTKTIYCIKECYEEIVIKLFPDLSLAMFKYKMFHNNMNYKNFNFVRE